MKFDSKLFDRIRVKQDREAEERARHPQCEWPGCTAAGSHRAPKGRLHEGEYHKFCLDHVRLYNKSYNYFDGMGDDAVADFQKAATFGHRPTWSMGVNSHAGDRAAPHPGRSRADPRWHRPFQDPFGFVDETTRTERPRAESEMRKLKALEKKSLETLDLPESATAPQIKARYKELVKRFHPDANGGNRSLEDRLREIIQAYNYLKSAGFC